MSEIVLINPFVVPRDFRDEFFGKYREVMERLATQPGFLGGALHRAADAEGSRFQFVNVNRWESAEAFRAGIAAVDPSRVFGALTGQIEANPALFEVAASFPPAAPHHQGEMS